VTQVWIALLRAVNLGSRNKVPMAELRVVLEEAGYESVRTYIQSGNVLFEHDRPDRARLEGAVAQAFGVRSTIVLRSSRQVRSLARRHPFGADTSKSHVAFLAEKPTPSALRTLSEFDAGADRYELVGPDVALQYPSGVQGARLTAARLEKLLGIPATGRNWRTVATLAELAAETRASR
jgi:uncharacterized protein (DUF1697 family)